MQNYNAKFKILTISFFILLGFFGLANLSFAAPAVSSVAGAVSHGQNVIINGSGFGVKNTVAPLKWDNFENGTIGQVITTASGWWIEHGEYDPLYVNDVLRTNSTKSLKYDFTTPYTTGPSTGMPQFGVAIGQVNLNYQKLYITFWKYMTTAGGLSRNYKEMSFRSGTPGQYGATPSARNDMYPLNEGAHIYTTNCNGDMVDNNWYSYPLQLGKWYRVEYLLDLGTPGVANGGYWYWTEGQLRESITNQILRSTNCTISNVYISNYFATDTNSATALEWIDDVYFDITPARVEICSGPTWATRSHCEIQIPSAWSDTSTTVTANQGSFNNGDTAYLYVADADGNANANGYLVTLGGTPDTTPPAAPQGLTVL
jgi:hypothetical protein